jgi:hypothetical protein
MIEGYFPNLPKIELHRRGPARPGWDVWGNEACRFGFDSARAGARYMLEACGSLQPGMTIDRVDGRRG